ncbi:ribosome small subunit-dependent GTPase A [Roseateles sp. DAIF2]|uniref:ribosome small subunit-dependent GTPase A n=1 Tax=Roseateles sp. DAIF2 TaxID=2714952 RepID=UPI0018A25797|nr:ribosome small subunit-dependent GTPase A [Roseateles sp. DAIF2]QPF72808.1 ribosome small subunit-dependent GTPase A [Roseateles sp. DAIF2]
MLEILDIEALRTLGLNLSLLPQLAGLESAPDERLWRVTEVQRDRLNLQAPHAACRARLLPALQQRLFAAGEQLAVGDWVLARTDAAGATWVGQRLTPLNLLSRRDPEGQRQALVSNVDTALLVMGLDHDFKLARLDRYLVLTRAAGVATVIVLSKADLCRDVEARLADVEDHLAHSRRHDGGAISVLAVDGTQAEATRARLAPWLGRGQTLVLLGSSGAGKSTLTNALCGATLQSTGAVREDDSRGRHTTTVRTLHRTPDGACIIDTPGLRGLQLDASSAELDAAFDDVATLARACRFRNCSHNEEPGCAVRAALAPARLKSYQKLQREARREDMGLLERRAQLQQWKARSRAAHAHIRSKRNEA